MAGAILPLALLSMLAGCGSSGTRAVATQAVSGTGFTVEVPASWHLSRTSHGFVARNAGSLVSVTHFALRRRYLPSQFAAAAAELDRVADQLAGQAGAAVTDRWTTTVAGRSSRAYAYAHTRVGFVLVGRREFELLCSSPDGKDQAGACALLFSSFTVS